MTFAFKKTMKTQPSCFFALLLLMIQGCAHANKIIYGMDNAHQLSSSAKGPFYIQLGSFSSAEHATNYSRHLKLNSSYPVIIVRHGAFYAVEVGPIASASAVRAMTLAKGQLSSKVNTKQFTEVSHTSVKVASTTKPQLLKGQWTIGADFGITFPYSNHTMTVNNGSDYPEPLNVDQFSVAQQHHPAVFGVQIGRRWERAEQWVPAYAASLRYQHLFTQDLHGSISQYSLPEFKNYSYRWGMSAEVLSLNGKINIVRFGRVMPYVDAGLGVSLNRGMSYQESAYEDVTPRVSPGFTSHRQGQFYYNAGAGLDVQLTPQVIVYGGYNYQHFGRMSSGRGQSTWAGERLSLRNFASNTVLVGLTYVVGDSLL